MARLLSCLLRKDAGSLWFAKRMVNQHPIDVIIGSMQIPSDGVQIGSGTLAGDLG